MAKGIEAQKLKALSSELVPTLWRSERMAQPLLSYLNCKSSKLRKMVKVRILKTALIESSRDEIAHELGQASGAQLVDLKGATAVYLSPYRIKQTSKNSVTHQRK